MSSKQPKTIVPSDVDLEKDPGIGISKGLYRSGGQPEDIKGDQTFLGDVKDEPKPDGGVDPDHLGRTNK